MLRKHWRAACAVALVCTGLAQARSQPQAGPGASPERSARAPDLFEQLDRDGDGKLTREELGPRGRAMLDRFDRSSVDREDIARLREKRGQLRQQRRSGARELRASPERSPARAERSREHRQRLDQRLERLKRRNPEAFERLEERRRERQRSAPAVRPSGYRV